MKDKTLKKNKKVSDKRKPSKKVKFSERDTHEEDTFSEGSSFDMASLSEFDFDDSDAEVEFWGRKLGLSNSNDAAGKARLKAEFERDGLGDDFIDLFDFMEKFPKKRKSSEKEQNQEPDESPSQEAQAVSEPPMGGKYLPPHLRKEFTVSDDGVLKKRSTTSISLTGLLNRVSEGNLDSISSEIISLVSKQKVAPSLIAKSLVSTACDNPHISITLQATFAAIVCAIAVETAPSSLYSGAVLATLISSLKETSETRTRLNLIRFLSILYSLGLFSSDITVSLLRFLASLSELDQESRLDTILTCLRFSGRVFKDTNRSKFNMIIEELVKESLGDSSSKKCEFLLKELQGISKSNFRAVDHLQTVCHWLTTRSATSKKSKLENAGEGSTLSVWKVPKAVENVQLVLMSAERVFQDDSVIPKEWSGDNSVVADADESAATVTSSSQPSLEELAVMNRMTTEAKKNAFIAIMGSVDADHALIRLDQFELLKGTKNIPSIVAVVIHCCLMESLFNKFYSDIVDRLCGENGASRRINLEQSTKKKFTFQFKSEFRRLIRSGELSHEKIQILSQIISRFVASATNVSIEDIFS